MAARKTSELPTRIWKFGALPPTEGAGLADEIRWRSARYYNRIIEIERARHARYGEIRRRHAPDLGALEDRWEALDDEAEVLVREAKRARKDHFARTGERTLMLAPDVNVRLAEIRAEKDGASKEASSLRREFAAAMEPARDAYRRRTTERAAGGCTWIKSRANREVHAEMMDEDWPGAWKEMAESERLAQADARDARGECGLPPGTYLLIEESVQRAKKDSLPRAPRFRTHRGDYRIGVQGKGMIVGDLFGNGTMLRLVPSRETNRRGKQGRHFVVRIRAGSDGRAPIWVSLPVLLHRMPPRDATVKWAVVHARHVGERMRYELQLTLEHASFAEPKRPSGIGDGGRVRIGWGKTDDGVRVATWRDGEVIVPTSVLAGHEYSARVRGHADAHFDLVKRYLRLWMRGGPHRLLHWERVVGDRRRLTFRGACEAFARYAIGEERVRGWWRAWVAQRRGSDLDLFASPTAASRWVASMGETSQEARAAWLLYTWTRKDGHLRQLAADVEVKFQRRRDAIFRREAIRISTAVETIAVDDYEISPLKERPELVTSETRPNDIAQHNAHAAAPGRFREILLEVMGPRCTEIERSSDARTTGGARSQKRRAVA